MSAQGHKLKHEAASVWFTVNYMLTTAEVQFRTGRRRCHAVYKGTTCSRHLTLSGARPVREVEEVDKGLNISRGQDALADSSPVHALEILLRQLLLLLVVVVAAAIAVAGAATRKACRCRRVLLLNCSRVPRVGGRTVAQPRLTLRRADASWHGGDTDCLHLINSLPSHVAQA